MSAHEELVLEFSQKLLGVVDRPDSIEAARPIVTEAVRFSGLITQWMHEVVSEQPWLAKGLLPEGWAVVPVEPTEAMLQAAEREWDGRMYVRSTKVWQTMLEAAPSGSDPKVLKPAMSAGIRWGRAGGE